MKRKKDYSNLLFSGYLEVWLENIKIELRSSTYRDNVDNVNNHVDSFIKKFHKVLSESN